MQQGDFQPMKIFARHTFGRVDESGSKLDQLQYVSEERYSCILIMFQHRLLSIIPGIVCQPLTGRPETHGDSPTENAPRSNVVHERPGLALGRCVCDYPGASIAVLAVRSRF